MGRGVMVGDGSARRATIDDVARLAGVSKSTVSRTLNATRGAAGTEVARRIRRVADELEYSPNLSAANLRRQRTDTLGVVVPRLTDTVMAMLYEEIAVACRRSGRHALVATTGDTPDMQAEAADLLVRRGVDGLIMTTARLDDPLPAQLQTQGVAVVLALRTDGGQAVSAAVGDDHLGGYLATRHLLDLGHRRIALVAGPEYATSALGRAAGYRDALAEANLAEDPDLVVPCAFTMEGGEAAARLILRHSDPPTAILAINDHMAIGVMAAARQLGFDVPGDLSVVGYNDIPLAARLPVPLTSVRVPFREIAEQTVALVDEAGKGVKPRQVVFAPTLIPRGSTKCYSHQTGPPPAARPTRTAGPIRS
jgi:LacI family transcriptional regulator